MTDDLYTHKAVPVEVKSTGCAGELCPGPDSDHPCAACRNGTVRTDVIYRTWQDVPATDDAQSPPYRPLLTHIW